MKLLILRSVVDQIFKMNILDDCWGIFASPFAVSNNSKVVCIFHFFDMNQNFYRCSAIKSPEAISVAEVVICLNKDIVSVSPAPLSSYVQNSSSLLILNVQLHTNTPLSKW